MNHLQYAPNPETLPILFLGYSLLIILVCAAALAKIAVKWQRGRYTQGFRMLLGLLGLLILRLAVFLSTYLSWQSEPLLSTTYIHLDLAASLIGIILISWMWNFPERSRYIDLPLLALTALIVALVSLQLSAFPSLLNDFLGSTSVWQGASITLAIIGCGLILLR